MTTPLVTKVLIADDHTVVRHGLRALLDRTADFSVADEVQDGAAAVDRALAGGIDLAVLDITMPRMTGLQAAAELHRRAPSVRTLILSMHDDEQYFFQALRAGASGYVLKSAADRDLVEACRATMRGEPFVHAGAIAALIQDYLDRVRRGDTPDDEPLTPREISQRRPDTRVLMLSMHDNEQYFFEALKAGAAGYVLKSAADRELVEACRAAMRGESVVFRGAVTALIRDYLDRVRRGEDGREDPLTAREREVVKLIAEAHTNEQIAEQLVISRKTVERHRANILEKLGMRDRVELTRYAIRRGLVIP